MTLSPTRAPADRATARILLATEAEGPRAELAAALRDLGHHVLESARPAEAAKRLERGEGWDLLLVETCDEDLLLELSGAGRATGIVVLCPRPTFELAATALRCGMLDCMETPAPDGALLARRIEDLLVEQARRREARRHRSQLEARIRELEGRNTLLERKVAAVRRNLREQLNLQQRAREVFYTDLSRVMAIFDGLEDGIVFTDDAGKVILVNPSAGEMLGTPAFTALGKPLSLITDHHPLLDVLVAHHEADLSEAGVEAQVRVAGRDLPEAIYNVHTNEVRDYQGKLSGVLSLIRDVTTSRKTEQLKNQFLSIVAHELRTPLTTIKAFATILDKESCGTLSEQHRPMIRHILSQSDRLANEIDKIISLGRLEAEDFTPDLQRTSVEEILSRAVSPFEDEAEKKRIRLAVEHPPERVGLFVDPHDIRRAVRALVENALKFTPEGGSVALRVRATDDLVRFEITDTGIGIDPENHRTVFEKFFQVENPLTRKYGGSGLGLSFAAEILEAHGSRVEVESELGRGSTFRFCLPRLPLDEDLVAEPGNALSGSPEDGERMP